MDYLKRGYGLDANGFIKSDVSVDKIDEIYMPSINDTVEKLSSLFNEQLHSVYLYGSVARGDAIIVKSDLDLIAIFNHRLNEKERMELRNIQTEQSATYRHLFREVGIAVDDLETVMKPEKYYENAFLKELSVCIYGEDLGEHFGPYQLTADIPISFNGDISNYYNKILKQIEASTEDELRPLAEKICRKLIRTFYSMVIVRAQIWTTKLDEQAEVFLQYFPAKKVTVQTLLSWLNGTPIHRETIYVLFKKEGEWASTNFEREAVKI